METESTVKEGYLLFPPHGVLGQLKFQKSWHKKYCQLFNLSQQGIERLEIFDSEEDSRKSSSVRIITLENCIKISQDSQKHQQFVFMVVTKSLTHYIAAFTQKDMLDWVVALQTVAFRCESTQKTVEEDNELYCSSGEGVYSVKLIPTETSTRCGLNSGPYTLICLESEIQLMGHSRILLTWPYYYIRKYGHREGTFTFEAGRKCPSGAGHFHFEHGHGMDIFRCISSRMKNMRKVLDGGSSGELPVLPSPLPTQEIDKSSSIPMNLFWSGSKNDDSGSCVSPSNAPTVCVDEILQAAVNNMEAGSRSPLSAMPPFGSGLSINVETTNSSLEDLGPMPIKSFKSGFKPAKPQRKTQLPHNVMSVKQKIIELANKGGRLEHHVPSLETDSGSQHSYDSVEVRKNAWRTLGVVEMPHTENSPKIEGDVNLSKERKKVRDLHEVDTIKVPTKPKIVMSGKLQDSDDDQYDKLQHLGTQTTKRNANSVDSRYKQVTPMSLSSIESQGPIHVGGQVEDVDSPYGSGDQNDYDDVEDCMQAVRLADDSHLGYGMIRKKTLDGEEVGNVTKPSHAFYNDVEYAVIEKPKKSSPKH